MNKLIKFIAVWSLLGMMGCDYLDVVPNDTPTLDHAFSNRSVTEKFLRTCYSAMPDPTDPFYYPAYFTSRDEFDWRSHANIANSPAALISRGLQNSNNPYQDYWSGKEGGKALYIGIRDCNIFLDNAHIPQDIDEQERARWIAEVKFLKAYYHFFLMKLYGPIVLVKENLTLAATPEQTQVYREPVDECVDYIVQLLDESIADLPLTLPNPTTELGRVSQTIARGVKAKVLAWGASPLFNGNQDYAGWKDNRGKQLISTTYDQKKWERASIAIKEAIDAAHNAGHQLYQFNKSAGGLQTYAMNDTLVTMMTVRKAVTEQIDRNSGMIWAAQEQFADGKGGQTAWSVLGNMLKALFPVLYTQDQPSYVNMMSASWHMAELFYSNNGVPIEEDRDYDYANRYKLRRAISSDKHESYIATGETTVLLHFNREPRFYANLGIDRGFFELSTTTANGGSTFAPFIKSRPDELISSTPGLGSYTPKKIIPFESSASQGDQAKRYTAHPYHFPLLRLSDLYLLYSEALNEMKTQPDAEVYEWIDKVRDKSGLDGVVDSWARSSNNPDAPRRKADMRKIIQKERLIELAFEGQRFWDVRRWKTASQYWSLPPMSWANSVETEKFYIPTVYSTNSRQFMFRDYLYPIRNYDLRINPNLVQTYGW